MSQVGTLAAAFGVEPSYFLDRSKDPSVLDGELVAALKDETAQTITWESYRLPDKQRCIVLGIVRQFEDPSPLT